MARRLWCGKTLWKSVFIENNAMSGTACTYRLLPGKYVLPVSGHKERGWCSIHLRGASVGTISKSLHAWENLTASRVSHLWLANFSIFGSCLTVPPPDIPVKAAAKWNTSPWCGFQPFDFPLETNLTHRHPSLFDGKPVKYLDEVAVICSWKQLGSAQSVW